MLEGYMTKRGWSRVCDRRCKKGVDRGLHDKERVLGIGVKESDGGRCLREY